MDLVTGDIADYRTFTTQALRWKILDHEERKLTTLAYHWDELAPLLRGLYVYELDGFFQDPEGFKRYVVEETSDAFEEPFIIRDQQTGRYYDLDDIYQTFETRKEAEAFAVRLNTPFLEGIPSCQVRRSGNVPCARPPHRRHDLMPLTDTTDRIPMTWPGGTWLRRMSRKPEPAHAGHQTPDHCSRRKQPDHEPVTAYPGER